TINAYIAEVNKEYAQYTRMPGLGIISEYRAKYLKIITIAFVIAAGLSVILGVIIVKMYHHPHRGMRFLAYAFGGTACMSFAAPFVMLVSGKYKGLNFSPQHFYNFAVGYISDALKSCLFAALFWLAATVAIAFAIKFIRKKLINESK
ncbi:MAG: hypothetical protein IKX92_04005, partial [Clostridia bacterium]|nr:hypothetical protein [Clostridia bacterium]